MARSSSSQVSQAIPQEQSDGDSQQQYKAPLKTRLILIYLYFLQGMVSSVAGTVIYIYPELPNYHILSIFTLSNLPYSLKFLSAPIVEKYSNFSYGKRKTWIVLSQVLTIILIFASSFLTEMSQAKSFAIIFVVVNYSMTLQDISLDGLSLKQLKNGNMMSRIQSGGQTVGIILGSMALLKLTSKQFAAKIGLKSPITNLHVLLICLCILIAIGCLCLHFLFSETYVQQQRIPTTKPLYQIYRIYRVFLWPSYRYFRTFLFMIIFYQGINFFVAGYNYQLINKGFQRDTLNTIDNLNIIFQLLFVYFFGHYANYWGLTRSLQINLLLTIITFLYLWIWFPVTIVPIFLTSFLIGMFMQWENLISTQINANFPQCGVSGMIYTGNASGYNLGKMLTIQTALLDKGSWRFWAMFGMCLQMIIILLIPFALNKIDEGQTGLQELEEFSSDSSSSYKDSSLQSSRNDDEQSKLCPCL